jgi:hypothetical protein
VYKARAHAAYSGWPAAALAGFGLAIILRHMRGHARIAQSRHMNGGVISLVLAHGNAPTGGLCFGFEHRLRSLPLGRARGLCHHGAHRQTVPVVHQRMAHVAKFGPTPCRFAVQPAVWVGGAGMRVVAAFLAVKIRAVDDSLSEKTGGGQFRLRDGGTALCVPEEVIEY